MIKVCTGWAPAGRVQYGERFLRSFNRFWPADVRLEVYVEELGPPMVERSLWDIEGARDFHWRHRDSLAVQGRVAMPCWKERERAEGYSFRTDAYKFWKQILIPEAAAVKMEDGDLLVWLDGDVETIAPVPVGFVEGLLGGADVCFLGREPKHSEIGFWAVRLSPITRDFLSAIADCYRSDAVFSLPQWHSAYVWDYVRRSCQMVERDLTPRGHGHVWPSSPLARYTRHDKGGRKPGGHR